MPNLTDLTEQIKKALSQESIVKASWTQATGLVNYELEAPAKSLVPVLTPLRNKIARVKGVGGTQANWKAVTAFDSSNLSFGIGEGNRGAEIQPTVVNYAANFVGCGLDSSFTFEAEYAGQGFDDVRARNTEQLLKQVMIKEEQAIVGGLGTFGLGTCPTPVAALATTVAGTAGLTSGTAVNVYCVALTLDGFMRTGSAGLAAAGTACPGQITKTNADASTDVFGGGNGQVSAASNAVTPTGGTLAVTATVTFVKGASAYAWYVGNTAATAGFAAITTVNTVTLSANALGTQKANDAKVAADFSQNALIFDGLISQATKSGSNAYFKSLDGAFLTSDSAGGINEIDVALQYQWDINRNSPSVIYVNSQEARNIARKVIPNGGAALYRINGDDPNAGIKLAAGAVVGAYLNKFGLGTGQLIPIMIHPNVPAGTILMVTEELPYPVSNVSNVIQMKLRQDYFQVEWPIISRKRGFGIYFDGVLQNYAPFSMCVISNVGNG